MDIEKKIIQVFADVFQKNESDIKFSDSKMDIESWDSIGHLRLIMSLEEKFNIRLKTNDIIRIDSVKKCIDIIREITNKG